MPRDIPNRSLSIALASTAAGALGCAFLDITLATLRAAEPTPIASYAIALAAAIALYGVAALMIGLGIGVLASSVIATLRPSPGALWRQWRSSLATDAERDRNAAAGVLATGGAAGVLAAVVFVFMRALALEMASKRNAALSTALVAAAALPIAALGWFPIYRALRPAARLLPRPRALWALGSLGGVAMLGVLGALFSVDWRVLDFGPATAAGCFAALAAMHGWWWYAGPGKAWRERWPTAMRGGLATAAALLVAGTFSYTFTRFGSDLRSSALVGEETWGARSLLRAARHLADRDGDGFAGRLGGGDCNDHDDKIHPGADDPPGDGIDQDCTGGDSAPLPASHGTPLPATGDPPTVPKTAAPAATSRFPFHGNLLIITIDTLRADRLNATTMPRLDALARGSVVFTHAYAQAPNTPRSFPSFLTSRFPSQVHWAKEHVNFAPLAPDNVTFFEKLRPAVDKMVGIFSHFYMAPTTGIQKGFDEWDNAGALTLHDSNTDVAAPRITLRVEKRLKELGAAKERFVLWTHFFEPHSRYMEHAEYPVHASGVKGLEEKYDGEVSFVDRHVGRVLDALAAAGLDKDTAVVVFSDHGEGFGEHRFGGELMYFHGQTLYDELLRVPLLVRVPGMKPRSVDGNVMLVDLGPTLLELMGQSAAPTFVGRSLVGAMLGEPLAPAPVYAELLPAPSWNHSWRALVKGDRKLLYKISENTAELYDLATDPKEQHNLATRQPAEAASLKEALARYMAETRRAAGPPPSVEVEQP